MPYAAGGATDFVARTIGERLSKAVGQPVVVENKAGAGGALGVAEVARAPADGYTVLVTINDSQVNNAALFKTLPYGFEVMNTTPEQFSGSYKTEFDVITKRIRDFGIEAQ